MRRTLGLVATLAALVVTCAAAQAATVEVSRCGTSGSGDNREGWYLVRGVSSCGQAKRIERRVMRRGQPVGAIDGRAYRGWWCGGRMGSYWCATDIDPGSAAKLFLMRSCAPLTPGCPARTQWIS